MGMCKGSTLMIPCLCGFRRDFKNLRHLSKSFIQRLKRDAACTAMGGSMLQGGHRPCQHDKRLLQILVGACTVRLQNLAVVS